MTTSRRLLALALPVALVAFAWTPARGDADLEGAFQTITEEDVLAELTVLASPAFEGRDSPSTGLTRAAEHVAERLTSMGFEPVGDGTDASLLVPFGRTLPAPVEDACALASPDHTDWQLGRDFVPVLGASGLAQGEVVFVGFGIDDSGERYDDIPSTLAGRIALILEGEPRHHKKFEGHDEVLPAADLYAKLRELAKVDAEGVLVVRRPPAEPEASGSSRSSRRSRRGDEASSATGTRLQAEFGFRHTWASWVGDPSSRGRGGRGGSAPLPPTLEITPGVGSALLGEDILALAAGLDASGKAPRPVNTGKEATLASQVEPRTVNIENVIGVLRGSDPELADEYVVLGAHLDHVGVDPRGRIGLGADDNASGVSALLEVAEALSLAGPRRSVVAVAFGGEEDGLLGSRAFTNTWPVPREDVVAMLNMDMIGRGDAKRVVILGTPQNPGFKKLLKRANALHPTQLKKLDMADERNLFERSDHFPFHEAGIPVLFFFENLPITDNEDYHTWRDTLDQVDVDKVARTARLVFNTAWLLCDDDERPPAPR